MMIDDPKFVWNAQYCYKDHVSFMSRFLLKKCNESQGLWTLVLFHLLCFLKTSNKRGPGLTLCTPCCILWSTVVGVASRNGNRMGSRVWTKGPGLIIFVWIGLPTRVGGTGGSPHREQVLLVPQTTFHIPDSSDFDVIAVTGDSMAARVRGKVPMEILLVTLDELLLVPRLVEGRRVGVVSSPGRVRRLGVRGRVEEEEEPSRPTPRRRKGASTETGGGGGEGWGGGGEELEVEVGFGRSKDSVMESSFGD